MVLSRFALASGYQPFHRWYNNPSNVQRLIKDAHRHQELMRAALGPYAGTHVSRRVCNLMRASITLRFSIVGG